WNDAPVGAVLEHLTTHRRAVVRRAAATALAARSGCPVHALVRLLDDPEPSVRDRAAALLRQRGDGTDDLVTTLRHGSARAQLAAVVVLGTRSDAKDAVADWAAMQVERAEVLHGYRMELGDTRT